MFLTLSILYKSTLSILKRLPDCKFYLSNTKILFQGVWESNLKPDIYSNAGFLYVRRRGA